MPGGIENNKTQKNSSDDIKKTRLSRKKRSVTVVAVIVLTLIVIILFFLSPVFAIDKFEISDMQYYSEDEVIAVLNDLQGKNGLTSVFENTSFDNADSLIKLRLPDAENELIFNCPYIESVQITFSFPNKLKVDVTERKPIFLTMFHNTYLYVDSEGVVIETFTEAECPEYPLILGVEVDNYKIGCSIAEKDDDKIFVAMKLCNALSKQGILENNIDIIDVSNYNSNIVMSCSPSLTIQFGGTDDLETKVALLKAIMEQGYDGTSNGTIDFTSGKYPVFKPYEAEKEEIITNENTEQEVQTE